MSRFDRLLKLAKSATRERLERVEQVIYPNAARAIRSGELLDSQREAVLKALSVASGVSFREINRSYQKVAKADPNYLKDSERAGIYTVKDGAIAYDRDTRDGLITVPLCNFNARITEERERDDGVERTLTLVIKGTLANGQTLPTAEVSASQFGGMGWTVSA